MAGACDIYLASNKLAKSLRNSVLHMIYDCARRESARLWQKAKRKAHEAAEIKREKSKKMFDYKYRTFIFLSFHVITFTILVVNKSYCKLQERRKLIKHNSISSSR